MDTCEKKEMVTGRDPAERGRFLSGTEMCYVMTGAVIACVFTFKKYVFTYIFIEFIGVTLVPKTIQVQVDS